MKRILLSLFMVFALYGAPVVAQESPLIPVIPLTIVELYTSQGCSSCPPADDFLGDLAKRSDVLALSFHVDYWNYIGWNDPFASAVYTQRQRTYARQLSLRYVYTPQMVIQGTFETTGSKRGKINNFIEDAKALPRVPISLSVSENLTLSAGQNSSLNISISASGESFGKSSFGVWAVVYDKYHSTEVKRGENGGRTIENFNVVRDVRQIGQWHGQAEDYTASLPEMTQLGGDACAVFIQLETTGQIIGVANLDL